MNNLKTHTLATAQPDTFQVYWTNSISRPRGMIQVKVTQHIDDRAIAAELAVIQHLLENKCVLGDNLVGNANTRLVVSQGAIRKLQKRQSDKVHLVPYANFLTTRFAGCPVSVDKDAGWFEGFQPASAEKLQVSKPRQETVKVAGLGEVAVTQHVMDRFASRFLTEVDSDKSAQMAWKKLAELASNPSVKEVSRESLWAKVKHSHPGHQEGRYFLNTKLNLVMVVTDRPHEGKRLVTAYPATGNFRDMAVAA